MFDPPEDFGFDMCLFHMLCHVPDCFVDESIALGVVLFQLLNDTVVYIRLKELQRRVFQF